ncbi:MAG TPA: Flp family type IVb pilin [Novosphingobium sp.]|nr:Flp family type IVb pilin [Novosphingobium sp.]
MLTLLRQIHRDETGAAAIEYGLILAMIVLAMMAALGNFANESNSMWTNIKDKTEEAVDRAR